MQTDSSPSPEPQAKFPVPPPSPRKVNFPAIVLGVFLLFSLVALAGVGFWVYRLNTNLKATQADLAALQGQYESLTAEKDQLITDLNTTTSELDATKTELDQSKADLSNAQSELDTAKKEASDLRTRMKRAAQYVDVLRGFFLVDSTYTQHNRRVEAVDDSTLSDLLDIYENTDSDEAWADYVSYIIDTSLDHLE